MKNDSVKAVKKCGQNINKLFHIWKKIRINFAKNQVSETEDKFIKHLGCRRDDLEAHIHIRVHEFRTQDIEMLQNLTHKEMNLLKSIIISR